MWLGRGIRRRSSGGPPSSGPARVLFLHNARRVDERTGALLQGAISDDQARRAQEATSGPFDYRSFPDAAHRLHAADPALFATTLREWAITAAPCRS
ncbi:hypothetical protein GCM10010168_20360 [Actinoplanes ianthinogenes]|uniref:Uncharacterized protein n=1 Tax=Actinoplanes ianthinogenes TaxID=122358 RepID=A0ABM7M7S4_9ACTN|nr:hypothetical protein [Actinoplanes ianthinogenes]BCJ47677.1 hypothetical protein Aiant_83340 [Actinoplanes ianthinogenes]GGR03397.1 hypothetical protein GCM10010168_20360 [Actinoplanes ianthinogenes]